MGSSYGPGWNPQHIEVFPFSEQKNGKKIVQGATMIYI